jgi:RNA polymerase sigma factor (sigma-70 family)
MRSSGDYRRVDMEDGELAIEEPPEDLIALDEALAKLEGEDRAVADVVKLRYFGGLSLEQAAEILGISRRTADRYWAYARARLYQEITKGNQPPPR